MAGTKKKPPCECWGLKLPCQRAYDNLLPLFSRFEFLFIFAGDWCNLNIHTTENYAKREGKALGSNQKNNITGTSGQKEGGWALP